MPIANKPIFEAVTEIAGIEAKDASVRYIHMFQPRAVERHMHAEGQLFSLTSGLCIVETALGSWLFPPRRCGWIPAGQPHSVRSEGQISGWSLYLAAPLCEPLPKTPMVLSLSPLLEHLMVRLSTWKESPPEESLRQSFLDVVVEEIRIAQEQPLHLPMPQDPRLLRLAEEMSRQPDTDRPLAEWARQLGMSERSLQREFLRETGISLGQWRQQLRILFAIERLSEGMSVTDTCFAVGYNNVSAFIKAFRRIVGVTPLEYFKNYSRSR